jgi:DNA gyrase subunit A
VLALVSLDPDGPGIALGTERGVVKRVVPDYPANAEAFPVVRLDDGDRVVGAVELRTGEEELVFVTSDAQLLRFPAGAVRPQGRAAGGMAGVRLSAGARVCTSARSILPTPTRRSWSRWPARPGRCRHADRHGQGHALPGIPAQGPRHRRGALPPLPARRGRLLLAWVGSQPARAAAATGVPVELPPATGRRDGSGTGLPQPVASVSGPRLTG